MIKVGFFRKNENYIENFDYKNYILSVLSCVKYHNILNLLKGFKLLKEESVSIDDEKITIFSIYDKNIMNIVEIKDIRILEALIYCNLKKIYKNYEPLNGENKLMKIFTKNL